MFQFVKPAGKNEEGRTIYKALLLNEIDKLACAFWSVDESPKFYASPKYTVDGREFEGPNWFDTIGHAIEECQYRCRQGSGGEYNYYHDAEDQPTIGHGPIFRANTVSAQILRLATLAETNAEGIFNSVKYYQPYIEFLFHLQNEHGILFEARGW